jgi:hypothetical protein
VRVYTRPIYRELVKRIRERRRFIQVLAGPRQSGKTTLARQVMDGLGTPVHYASADEPRLREAAWVEQQWEIARLRAHDARKEGGSLLILDEVQKVTGWSETVKRLWDEDTSGRAPVKVLILGSSPLLMQRGLTESLAGRFELIPASHWSFAEMRDAFGWDLDRYIYFGGYPGAASLIDDEVRWSRYVLDSLIETTLSRDIFLLNRVDKPALLRQLFHLSCDYSAQILSYQKMLGQLQDAGNTVTVAHYLRLLSAAWMVTGLPKYSAHRVRQRASSPKLQVLNTALMTAQAGLSFKSAQKDRSFWGRLVESAVGAHILNSAMGTRAEIFYWRERSREVDFVVSLDRSLLALEVRSGRKREGLPGMDAFSSAFRPKRKLLVGGAGISVEEFLLAPLERWFTN